MSLVKALGLLSTRNFLFLLPNLGKTNPGPANPGSGLVLLITFGDIGAAKSWGKNDFNVIGTPKLKKNHPNLTKPLAWVGFLSYYVQPNLRKNHPDPAKPQLVRVM